jgi:bifunctional DNA-binding transcriptional regulator/antitoxin component of YhaV-PrlF toxin-antitoxin module
MTENKATIQQTNSGQMIITIPKPIAKLKGWKKGTVLEFTEDRMGYVMLKESQQP